MKPQFKKTYRVWSPGPVDAPSRPVDNFYYEIITNCYYRAVRTKQEIFRNITDRHDARYEHGLSIKGIRPCRSNSELNSWNDFTRSRCWKKSWKDFTRQKKQWGHDKSSEKIDDFYVKTRKHRLSLCGESVV